MEHSQYFAPSTLWQGVRRYHYVFSLCKMTAVFFRLFAFNSAVGVVGCGGGNRLVSGFV